MSDKESLWKFKLPVLELVDIIQEYDLSGQKYKKKTLYIFLTQLGHSISEYFCIFANPN
jgi:hypothetical protein